MNHQALTKILTDVAPTADSAAYIEFHSAIARKNFRASFQRQATADEAWAEGDTKTAVYFSNWAKEANDRGEAHLNLVLAEKLANGSAA